jgi:hypothetical protein
VVGIGAQRVGMRECPGCSDEHLVEMPLSITAMTVMV